MTGKLEQELIALRDRANREYTDDRNAPNNPLGVAILKGLVAIAAHLDTLQDKALPVNSIPETDLLQPGPLTWVPSPDPRLKVAVEALSKIADEATDHWLMQQARAALSLIQQGGG